MNDLVSEYLKKKYGEDFEQKAKQDYEEKASNLAGAGFVGDIGSLIAGQKVGQNDEYFNALKKEAKEKTLGMVDRAKDGLYKDYAFNKAMGEDKATEAQQKELADPNSKQTKQMQALAMRMVPGYDFSTMSGLEISKQLPTLQKIFEVENKKAESNLDRDLKRRQIEATIGQKTAKDAELGATQAKQLGLAKSGQLANKQYEEAIAQGYDPTSYATMIDKTGFMPQFMKSDLGKKAMSAQSAWVESYLRDASGAAIPPSERQAYAQDYFPQPGDTPEIVANKAALRKQKEDTALIGAGKGAKQFEPDMPMKSVESIKSAAEGDIVVTPKGKFKKLPNGKFIEVK